MSPQCSSSKIPLGITMGCPAGIGPEILIKYFHGCPTKPNAVILGDINILQKAAALLCLDVDIVAWKPGQDIDASSINVLPISSIQSAEHHWGTPNNSCATAMVKYITEGVKYIQDSLLSGIVTCPISKLSLNNAGFNFPGHTEMLAALTHTQKVVMMMAGDTLKVTLVTIHCALADVPQLLTQDKIHELIKITHKSLVTDFDIANPRIAVAALNPHAGEGGLFGSEERIIIEPAIKTAQSTGINVQGPFPPDTVFHKAASGSYDAVVCMYHDQGLIPFKLLHFEDGVNVTLGLPIVRTSVDHGTAYDIAGTGVADYKSLQSAINLATQIVRNRQQSS